MKLIIVIIFFVVSAFSSADYYTLQLGAFSSKKNAQKFIKNIKHKDNLLKPFIMPIFGLYKVYVGKYNSFQEAKQKKEYLVKNLNINAFVKRIELDKKDKPKNLLKDRVGVQIAALRNIDGLKKMQNMFDGEYDFDVIKKDDFYKLIIKCKNRNECKKRLYTIQKEIDKNAFLTKYKEDDLYVLENKTVNKEIVYSAAEYSNNETTNASLTSTTGDNAYIAASSIQKSETIEFNNENVAVEQDAGESHINKREKREENGLLDGFEVEFQPIILNSKYLLYENRITNSKINVNGKRYSNPSSTNSLGFGIDFYEKFFFTGKLGTRSSNRYLIDLNNKKLNVKVKYPIVAFANLGYKYDLGEYELYKLYLYSALGTSITKKDVQLIDFNNVKYTDSTIYFDYSLSGGFMMNFYNDLFFKIGAGRDFGNRENSLEFSLSYEF